MAQSRAEDATEKKATRRGRPSVSRATSIDRQIRAAALELFLEQGFDAVTMDMIAQRAQVSKPTLYTRHQGKVELLRVVVQDEVARWLTQARGEDGAVPADLESRLRTHAANIIASQSWNDLRRLSRLINGVAANHPEILTATYEAGLHPVINFLAADLREAAARSGLQRADWDFLAEMFFHAIFGWYNAAAMLGEDRERDAQKYIDKMVALVVAAAAVEVGTHAS
jgi:AcrR family transcriptional regulator